MYTQMVAELPTVQARDLIITCTGVRDAKGGPIGRSFYWLPGVIMPKGLPEGRTVAVGESGHREGRVVGGVS